MRFCFIIEDQYKHDSMPLVVARRLMKDGHEVDLLEPSKTVTSLCDLGAEECDAYVLKTVSDGPGISILQAAEAAGIPTINTPRSIRLVRDKSIAIAYAHAHGLPVPRSYFMVHPRLLKTIPPDDFPLIVKPTNGSSGRGIYRVNHPDNLEGPWNEDTNGYSYFLAQRYVDNPGYDIKLYVLGREVHAVARRSPLHDDVALDRRTIPVKPEWQSLARRVGKLFGLEIYGLDVLETPDGPVIVDINDFPGFGGVPEAPKRVANYIVHLAQDSRLRRRVASERRGAHSGRRKAARPAAPPLTMTAGAGPAYGAAAGESVWGLIGPEGYPGRSGKAARLHRTPHSGRGLGRAFNHDGGE